MEHSVLANLGALHTTVRWPGVLEKCTLYLEFFLILMWHVLFLSYIVFIFILNLLDVFGIVSKP